MSLSQKSTFTKLFFNVDFPVKIGYNVCPKKKHFQLGLIVLEKCWSTPVYEDSSSLKNRFKIDSLAK
jgi:hypothetical protein